MARRCIPSGYETAVPLEAQDRDDGKLSFAFLASKVARRVGQEELVVARAANETAGQHTLETLAREQSAERVEEPSSDEDPFGHIAMGMDEYEPHMPSEGEGRGHAPSTLEGVEQQVNQGAVVEWAAPTSGNTSCAVLAQAPSSHSLTQRPTWFGAELAGETLVPDWALA